MPDLRRIQDNLHPITRLAIQPAPSNPITSKITLKHPLFAGAENRSGAWARSFSSYASIASLAVFRSASLNWRYSLIAWIFRPANSSCWMSIHCCSVGSVGMVCPSGGSLRDVLLRALLELALALVAAEVVGLAVVDGPRGLGVHRHVHARQVGVVLADQAFRVRLIGRRHLRRRPGGGGAGAAADKRQKHRD